MKDGCAFCDYAGPNEILHEQGEFFVIEPASPVVSGHILVIPRKHMAELWERHELTGRLFAYVAYVTQLMRLGGRCNVIVNDGPAAGQAVKHVHVHLVPRQNGDGLKLPWSPAV